MPLVQAPDRLVPNLVRGLERRVAVRLRPGDLRPLQGARDASPALRDSLRDGVCYEEYTACETICDGLAGGIGQIVFGAAKDSLIDEIVIVSEGAVHQAVALFARDEQMIVEGSGAVGLAALMENGDSFRGKRVGLLVSGANIDAGRLAGILGKE